MRVATYNQMFGLNGRNLFSFLMGHLNVHYGDKGRGFAEGIDLERTLDIIGRSGADVVGITEILEGQEESLVDGLSRVGYEHVYFGDGHRTRFGDLGVRVAIASKLECVQKDVEGFPIINEMGGGGGIVHCYFPKENLDVVNLHLASSKKKGLYEGQLEFVSDYVGGLEGNVVLMGDFNKSYLEIGGVFEGLDFVSGGRKTCPTTWGLGFLGKDLDHIFSKGFEVGRGGTLEGKSDHRLVWGDLE